MSKQSKLKGVAHNTMDHAVSGPSFLADQVTAFFAASGESRLRLNLLPPAPASADTRFSKPLTLAAEACQAKFVDILQHAGFELSDVASAQLEFMNLDHAVFSCKCTLFSAKGKEYAAEMTSNAYWSARREDPFAALRKLRHGG